MTQLNKKTQVVKIRQKKYMSHSVKMSRVEAQLEPLEVLLARERAARQGCDHSTANRLQLVQTMIRDFIFIMQTKGPTSKLHDAVLKLRDDTTITEEQRRLANLDSDQEEGEPEPYHDDHYSDSD
jgi:hypothetical protein